jgi:hypothetical protein
MCVDLLRTGVLAGDEILKVLPVTRYLRFFHSLFPSGFIVTDKKVVIYSTQHFTGLKKKQDICLADLETYHMIACPEGQTFSFQQKDGTKTDITLDLSPKEGQVVDQELQALLVGERSNC